MWCILLILLPLALLFAESSMSNLQSVSIVAAFPIGAVIVMIALSFLKDAKKYLQEMKHEYKYKKHRGRDYSHTIAVSRLCSFFALRSPASPFVYIISIILYPFRYSHHTA